MLLSAAAAVVAGFVTGTMDLDQTAHSAEFTRRVRNLHGTCMRATLFSVIHHASRAGHLVSYAYMDVHNRLAKDAGCQQSDQPTAAARRT